MGRRAALLCSALVSMAVLDAGCGTNSSIVTESTTPPDIRARPQASDRTALVAQASACGQAFGYSHDPTKLKAAYVSYEAKEGATKSQLDEIEKNYETVYRSIREAGSLRAGRCAGKDSEEVKADLRRYQSGFFTARTPSAEEPFQKTVWETCGENC